MNADERRFVVPCMYWRGAGSLKAAVRQWRRESRRALYLHERGAQEGVGGA